MFGFECVYIGGNHRIFRIRNSSGVRVATSWPASIRAMRVPSNKSFAQIMSDEHNGFSQALLQGQKFALQFCASDGVERAEGFVHEQKRGIGGQSSSHADSLALAPGKFAGIARCELRFESDQLQHFVTRSECDRRTIFDLRNDADVARDGEMREQADFLNDVADHAAQADDVPFGEGRRRLESRPRFA